MLNEICFKGKSSLRQKDVINDGLYSVYGASGVVGTTSDYQNEIPYVAVIKDGAGVGRVSACEPMTSVLGTMQALIPNPNVERDYLLYLVRSLRLGEGFSGSTIPHIYFKDYGKIEVPLPFLEAQRRIVSQLGLIEAQVEQAEVQITQLDQLVKSRFVEMFEKCDVRVPLGKVCRFKSGKTLPKDKEMPSGDFLYAKVGDLNLPGNEMTIRFSRTYVDAATAKNCLIPKGSVVFPKRGGAIGTNKKRITSEDCCLDLNLMSVIPGGKICTEYLLAWIEQMDLTDIANGSTVPQINNKDLDPLIIPLPKMELQQEFAVFTRKVDKSRFVDLSYEVGELLLEGDRGYGYVHVFKVLLCDCLSSSTTHTRAIEQILLV